MASPTRLQPSAHSAPGMGTVSGHVLSSWKEIAAYLKKSVRTVQRWEAELGLPVHRPGETGVVLAYQSELDQWVHHGGVLVDGDGNGHGTGRANAAERFRRYNEARRRAALLCSAATARIQALQSTADQTRALCAALLNGAAQYRLRNVHLSDLQVRTAAPPAGQSYPNVTVDGGGSGVEGDAYNSQVA